MTEQNKQNIILIEPLANGFDFFDPIKRVTRLDFSLELSHKVLLTFGSDFNPRLTPFVEVHILNCIANNQAAGDGTTIYYTETFRIIFF